MGIEQMWVCGRDASFRRNTLDTCRTTAAGCIRSELEAEAAGRMPTRTGRCPADRPRFPLIELERGARVRGPAEN